MTLPFNFFQHQKHFVLGVSQLSLEVKNLPANAGDLRDVGLITRSGRSPGGGHDNPLSGQSHGQRRLVGYSPQSHKESDMTEAT